MDGGNKGFLNGERKIVRGVTVSLGLRHGRGLQAGCAGVGIRSGQVAGPSRFLPH